jgi:hypothetical protein
MHAKGWRIDNATLFLCADAFGLEMLPKRRNIALSMRFGALPGSRPDT